MAIKINSKIVGYQVNKPAEEAPKEAVKEVVVEQLKVEDNVIHMHEKVDRPDVLIGSTYKVKTPVSDHAMYITVNDIVLNQGTQYEKRRPFEIFINSKNLDHYQWIVALTRIISAVFRKGGDVTFLVEELKAVFDPRGGYWQPGGKFQPSIIAELGDVIEEHLISIGMLGTPEMSDHQKAVLEEKRAEYEAANAQTDAFAKSAYPDGAQLCHKCNTVAAIMMDGCKTCLSCGDSKCG
ncbi:MAG: NrdJb [Gammaproteobacteria bacterium]